MKTQEKPNTCFLFYLNQTGGVCRRGISRNPCCFMARSVLMEHEQMRQYEVEFIRSLEEHAESEVDLRENVVSLTGREKYLEKSISSMLTEEREELGHLPELITKARAKVQSRHNLTEQFIPVSKMAIGRTNLSEDSPVADSVKIDRADAVNRRNNAKNEYNKDKLE